ncbi:hypothetical protein BH18ACT13_BH18ACT13_21600 [soil metagenome]
MLQISRDSDPNDRRRLSEVLPVPTGPFRRRAWLQFQRALDPLASPKPLPLQRH